MGHVFLRREGLSLTEIGEGDARLLGQERNLTHWYSAFAGQNAVQISPRGSGPADSPLRGIPFDKRLKEECAP
jgi:hypothetical protein